MATATCSICLDYLKDPVSTPCGHLHCEECLNEHIDFGRDALESNCPTCRAPFSLVTPAMNTLPRRFQRFVTPTVRRIYLDTSTLETQEAQMKALEERLRALERDVTQHRNDARQWQAVARTRELAGTRLRHELEAEKAARAQLADEASVQRAARIQAERRLAAEKAARDTAHAALAEECKLSVEWEGRYRRAQAAQDRLERELEDERRAHSESCDQWRVHCDRIERYYETKAPAASGNASVGSDGPELAKKVSEYLPKHIDDSDCATPPRGRRAQRDEDEADLSFSPDRSSSPAADLRRSLATELSATRRGVNIPKKVKAEDKENATDDPASPAGRTIRPLPRRAVVKREREDEASDAELRKRTRFGAPQSVPYAERLGAKLEAMLNASLSSSQSSSLKASSSLDSTASFKSASSAFDKRTLTRSLRQNVECDDPECDDCSISAILSARIKA